MKRLVVFIFILSAILTTGCGAGSTGSDVEVRKPETTTQRTKSGETTTPAPTGDWVTIDRGKALGATWQLHRVNAAPAGVCWAIELDPEPNIAFLREEFPGIKDLPPGSIPKPSALTYQGHVPACFEELTAQKDPDSAIRVPFLYQNETDSYHVVSGFVTDEIKLVSLEFDDGTTLDVPTPSGRFVHVFNRRVLKRIIARISDSGDVDCPVIEGPEGAWLVACGGSIDR